MIYVALVIRKEVCWVVKLMKYEGRMKEHTNSTPRFSFGHETPLISKLNILETFDQLMNEAVAGR